MSASNPPPKATAAQAHVTQPKPHVAVAAPAADKAHIKQLSVPQDDPTPPDTVVAGAEDAVIPGGAAGALQLAIINAEADIEPLADALTPLKTLAADAVIESTGAEDLNEIVPASGESGGSASPGNTGHGTSEAGDNGPLDGLFGDSFGEDLSLDDSGGLAGTALDLSDPEVSESGDDLVIFVPQATEAEVLPDPEPPALEVITGTSGNDVLDLRNTDLSNVAEVDAAGGNDTVTASNLSDGVYRGGSGDDVLTAGTTNVTWLYSGASNGFDTLNNGAGTSIALAQSAGTTIGLNGYSNGVDEFQGAGDTLIKDTDSSRTLNFSNTLLTGIAEINAAGGNDTVTASNLSDGVYRGGSGDDVLTAGTTSVTWLYSGTSNGFDTLNNGAGTSIALAQTAGTTIGLNGYSNGVDEFQGAGDTLLKDTDSSRTLNFSNTLLTGIAEINAAAGNDTVTASNLSDGIYRGGSGDDVLTAGTTNVTWLYSGTSNGFDTLNNGAGHSVAVAEGAGTTIGLNGFNNGVDEFQGAGDTLLKDTDSSRTLNFSNTLLTGIAEINAAGGNDTVTASNLSDGVYRGGSGDDVLNAGTTSVTWLYSGTSNGFDTLNNGAGHSVAVAEGAGTTIGLNGFNNGVDEFQGAGDTLLKDTDSSRTLNFSNTLLTGIAEINAAGGNDTVTASNLSDGVYRGGSGDDVLTAGTTSVTWLYSGTSNGFDTLNNGAGHSVAVAEGAGTTIGLNGYANGVDEFQGAGDTLLKDTDSSRTLNFSNTLLTGIAEINAAGGNDTVTASNLSDGVYRGGSGDDVLNAGTTNVTWLYSGASNGFDTLKNGAGHSVALAEGTGVIIGVNGYANGVDEFQGTGDTVVLDNGSSHRLDLSDTSLSGIAKVDAAGGNDTVATALATGAAITYDGGAGTDVLRLSLTTTQAADAATQAEIAAYRTHLAGPGHADPFTLNTLGITVENFESLKLNNVIEIGGDVGPADGTANSLGITLSDVLDLTTEASNPLLTVLGDGNDLVTIDAGWTQQADLDGYHVFTQSVVGVGVVTLRIDDDVQSVTIAP